jgi:signal transduction histidine kinase
MQLINTLLVLSFLIGTGIGVFMIIRHGKNTSYLWLAGALITASFWALSILGGILTGNLVIANSAFAFAILIMGFLIFSVAEIGGVLSKTWRIVVGVISALSVILVYLPNTVASKISVVDGYIRMDQPGYLYPYFIGYFVVYTVFLIVLTRLAIKRTSPTKKRQLVYISFGFILSLAAGITLNLILPAFGVFRFNGLGPVFMLVMTAFAIYTATRHYLYEPRVILAELYAILLIFVSIIRLVMFPDITSYLICGLTVGLSMLFIRSTISGADKNLELRKDKLELLRLDKLKDEFLMMATHELNTPVTVLQGKMEMIIHEGFGHFAKPQKEYLMPVLENTEKLSRMFKHILEVVKLDEHRMELRKEPFDLRQLANKVIDEIELKHHEKYKIDFHSPAKVWINGDEEKVKEVIGSLLDNAVRYSCVGGSVGVIKLDISSTKSEVTISVSDNGIGIPKADQKHIAEKFFQSKRFDTDVPVEQQGSGLALYIARKIVELHHGRMWLDSKEGKGTTFFVSLPV